MKITVYTISSCPFSQQEKDYLKANNLPFEEKNLEQNREWLTEMLAVSNNFAGTPVTKIEDDKGQITVLKGFTKEEFDKVLGLTSAKPEPEISSLNAQIPVPPSSKPVSSEASGISSSPSSVSPQPGVSSSSPSSSSAGNVAEPTQPTQTSTQPTQSPQSQDSALQSILDNLQQNIQPQSVNQPSIGQAPVNEPVTNQSNSNSNSNQPASFSDPNLPKIPDFPK